jgi:hypothetical protein
LHYQGKNERIFEVWNRAYKSESPIQESRTR